MKYNIEDIKGVHPGKIVDRELRKRKLARGKFALMLNEYPQTFGAILLGKRKMNAALSLKIEEQLAMEEGFLMTLQVFYDIEQIKRESALHPNLSVFRKALFWDTDIQKIDWIKQRKAVIQRVKERGDEIEKREIMRFYQLNEL